jgi:hypothetical protein
MAFLKTPGIELLYLGLTKSSPSARAMRSFVHASAKKVDLVIEGEGAAVVLKITNQGTPIPGEMLDSIFEPLVHGNRNPIHKMSVGLDWVYSSYMKS